MRLALLGLLLAWNAFGEAYRAPTGLKIPPMVVLAYVPPPKAPPNWDIEPEFLEYVHAFKRDYFKYLGKVLTIGKLRLAWDHQMNSGHAGTCNRRGDDWWIGINVDSGWGRYSDCQREELVYHELGHCVLNENHTEFGIMHSGVRDTKVCEKTRDASKKYLFENARVKPSKREVEVQYYYEEVDE